MSEKKTDAELAREWARSISWFEDGSRTTREEAMIPLLRRLASQSDALRELVEAASSVATSMDTLGYTITVIPLNGAIARAKGALDD